MGTALQFGSKQPQRLPQRERNHEDTYPNPLCIGSKVSKLLGSIYHQVFPQDIEARSLLASTQHPKMAPIALPPSPTTSSSPLPSSSTSPSPPPNQGHPTQDGNQTTHSDPFNDSAHTFSWLDTLNIALTSCTPSLPSVSSCMPCLRTVPSDDSLNQHLNPSSRPSTSRTPTRNGGQSGAGAGRLGVRRIDTSGTWTPNADGSSIPRARPDELQGLLASASSDDDDAHERLSMHSNFGAGRTGANRSKRKKRRGKEKKPFTLFGYDLFNAKGRAKPAPITLGEEDGALYSTSALAEHSRSGTNGRVGRGDGGDDGEEEGGRTATTTLSLGTTVFDADSDAALLSARAIDELSTDPTSFLAHSAHLEDLRMQEAETRRIEKEERRRRRREKRESNHKHNSGKGSKEARDALERERLKLERAKMQGVLPEDGEEEFEGFQGSGAALPVANVLLERRGSGGRTRSGTTTTTTTTSSGPGSALGSGNRSRSESQGRVRRATVSGLATPPLPTTPEADADDFGDFVSVPHGVPEEPEDEDAVDLDGGLYSGTSRRPYSEKRASLSGSQSDSRSASANGGQPYNQHRRALSKSTSSSSQQNGPLSPSPLGPLSSSSGRDPLTPPIPTATSTSTSTSSVPKVHKKTKSSKKSSRSSGSTSQSTSIASPSPLSPTFSSHSNGREYVSPSTVEQGLGFFDAEDFVPSHTPSPPVSHLPQASPFGSSASVGGPGKRGRSGSVLGDGVRGGGGGGENGSGFPSTGFGTKRAGGERKDMVRFLSGGEGL